MIKKQISVQLGKQGITDNFILTLSNAFKTHTSIRISALKSSGRDTDSMKKIADEIVSKMPKENSWEYRIIGFTIILMKFRK